MLGSRCVCIGAAMLVAPLLLARSAVGGARSTVPWAAQSFSPHTLAPGATNPLEQRYLAACGRGDAALSAIAHAMVGSDESGEAATSRVEALQRIAGEPHAAPRIWHISHANLDSEATVNRLRVWLDSFVVPGSLRCGVGSSPSHPGELIVVATEGLADLDPIPLRVARGSVIDFRAHPAMPASSCKVVVEGPSGDALSTPVSCADGTAATRIPLNDAGVFTIQFVMAVAGGPRPALKIKVWSDVEPSVDGEAANILASETLPAVLGRLNAIRRNHGLGPLVLRAELSRLAQAHVDLMAREKNVAHDVGDGDPKSRMIRAGLAVSAGGENVGQASTLNGAQSALEQSPDHLRAMLNEAYSNVGLAAARDDENNVYLVEFFSN